MKNLNLNISFKCIILLLCLASLSTSCAKRYGCYFSAVPLHRPGTETLKPTGATMKEYNLSCIGDQTPNYADILSGLR